MCCQKWKSAIEKEWQIKFEHNLIKHDVTTKKSLSPMVQLPCVGTNL